jgi:hypothetical protein
MNKKKSKALLVWFSSFFETAEDAVRSVSNVIFSYRMNFLDIENDADMMHSSNIEAFNAGQAFEKKTLYI